MPLQATSGAASYDATGGGAPVKNYIEDVFSTWLYTGNGTSQTITNGIDLTNRGGMVFAKARNVTTDYFLFDTLRGVLNELNTNTTDAQASLANSLTAFNANGFSVGSAAGVNTSTEPYAAWTFREQPQFFDVVTYSGTGANRTVAHSLNSVPGMIWVKRTNGVSDWQVYHRNLANTQYLVLNSTAVAATGTTRWNSTDPTSTEFSLGTDASVNASGGNYVAYLFAHNAGGFGAFNTENVVSCGTYTGVAGDLTISVGYEPQLVFVKGATASGVSWILVDTMRGLDVQNSSWVLSPSISAITETTSSGGVEIRLNNGGFTILSGGGNLNQVGSTYVYMTIRRGPMRIPATGASVLGLNARTGTGASAVVTGGAGVSDLAIIKNRTTAGNAATWATRLTGQQYLSSAAATAQTSDLTAIPSRPWTVMDGVTVGTTSALTNASPDGFINYLFERAPGFMDIACYTGTGANRTVTHNLAAVPELMLVKRRDTTGAWQVYSGAIANTEYLVLNTTAAKATGTTRWNSTTPTASVFSLGTDATVNSNSGIYNNYLFATCPGVSKVGSYTGTGTTLGIDCGFTGGARFVLIKRTDSTGDWYVWDTARGIVSGNDPHLSLNTTAAEVTTNDTIDTDSTGFVVNQLAATNINVTSATYIFLAIA